MKTITVETAQGIGDIFWVYQKLAPYCDKIHLRILAVGHDKVQKRAEPWVKLFPKISKVDYRIVTSKHYDRVAHGTYPFKQVLRSIASDQRFEYCCNRPMELGTRLDQIDQGYKVEWSVPLQINEANLVPPRYLCVFISGSTRNRGPNLQLWSTAQWFSLLILAFQKMRLPIVLIGASYDQDIIAPLASELIQVGIHVSQIIDGSPKDVLGVIKGSDLFIGYQSGLNILADNMKCQQLMLYFPFLKPMLYTWCQPGHEASGLFKADTFESSPIEVFDRHLV